MPTWKRILCCADFGANDDAPAGWLMAFRWWVALTQAATILLTWPLWQVRDRPPLLPAIDALPQFYFGLPMLAALAGVLVAPRLGIGAYVAAGAAAMLTDQTRMQPQIVSGWFLLIATLPGTVPRMLGRAHLAALWFFAGFHKLITPDYYELVAVPVWTGVFPWAPAGWSTAFGIVLAVGEVAMGLLVLVARARVAVAWAGLVLHLGIFLALSLGLRWNSSVWAWNLSLMPAGFVLLAPWRSTLWTSLAGCRVWIRTAFALILLAPFGYYVGLVDGYLSFCLYSANTPRATHYFSIFQYDVQMAPWNELNVALPPAHRVYEAYFRRVGHRGEVLVIEDPRTWAHWWGYGRRRLWYDELEREPMPPPGGLAEN